MLLETVLFSLWFLKDANKKTKITPSRDGVFHKHMDVILHKLIEHVSKRN